MGAFNRLKKVLFVGVVLIFVYALSGCSSARRGPLDVKRVTYVCYAGDTRHIDLYDLSSDFKMKHYSIDPKTDSQMDLFAGELPSEEEYTVSEKEISDMDWTSLVNYLTRVNFMELSEELPSSNADDAATVYIRVETSDDVHKSGGYDAGYEDDNENERFRTVLNEVERIIKQTDK